MTRTKPGASTSRREDYEAIDNRIPVEEDTIAESDAGTRVPRRENRADGSNAGPGAARSSDDDFSSDNDTSVKLLPLRKPATTQFHRDQPHDTPSSSSFSLGSGDEPGEERDVGKRIERVLATEQRSLLSRSFNTNLEDGVFSDDEDDDYGFPANKSQPGKLGGNGSDHNDGNVKSGWRSMFRLTSWWSILGLGTVGVLLIWFAVRGLGLSMRSSSHEYDSVPWYPTPLGGTNAGWKESYTKAQALVERMSLIEKVNITTGTGWMMGLCVGNTGPAESVRFPSLCLQDGPLGLRFADNITAFPAGITTGATWNREFMRARGSAIGSEARAKGVNVILGPSMGALGMMPAGGRNWEAFGSDPVLQAVAASETIRGIQQHGVMATAKHFLMNEQEHFRQPFEWGIPSALSSNVDDRTLHEVFAWPFAESVRANVASIMCSYQMVNGSHACENSKLINGILKDELGFQGFVQSDWLAQRSGVQSALSGLDMSMPGDGLHWADGVPLWGPHLTRAALNTSVPMGRLNDMVTRVVAAWYQFHQDVWDEGPNFSSWTKDRIGGLHPGSPDDKTKAVVNRYVDVQGNGSQPHGEIVRQVAAEGTVLLKNADNTLPLSRNVSSPHGKYRVGIYGEDAGPGKGPNLCVDRGCNQGTLASGWGSGAVDFPYLVNPWDALQSAWPGENVEVEGYLTNDVSFADLTEQDLCLVFANSDGGEGFIRSGGIDGDRSNLFLQRNGSQLVEAVARNCGNGNGRTVVVVHSVGPVVLDPWIDLPSVHAVLYGNLPGQESGNALVDVIFGDVDASGRLPYTIGRNLEDYGPGAQVLYTSSDPVPQINFDQGLYIDYRYFDRHNITPRFEFGFGLSYTTFDLTGLELRPLQEKSRLPSPRPSQEVNPPTYKEPPHKSPSSVLFPVGFKNLKKYVYPYLTNSEGTEPGSHPYPRGYTTPQHPSDAGGGPGGNPSLYEPMLGVCMNVSNTGNRAGKEVVQVYVSFPDDVAENRGTGLTRESIEFPDRVLRNFTKVSLQPGETVMVNMTLSRKDLSYWSVRLQNWVLPIEGEFRIWAGRSSRDLPLVAGF